MNVQNAVPRKTVTVPQRLIDIVTDKGISFRVAFGNRMLNDGSLEDVPEVAFYDTRYTMTQPVHQHGQFVNAYSVETLLERQSGYPLNLYGGQSNWTIDASAMALVKMWLVNVFLSKD
jgi:hypothetical protein